MRLYISSSQRLANLLSLFFFFNDTATTEIYTLSLHDALPISRRGPPRRGGRVRRSPRATRSGRRRRRPRRWASRTDRKSTRLNSSHVEISYAVFCLKKKKKKKTKLYTFNINDQYIIYI